MRIVIAEGEGYIGKAIVGHFKKRNHEVIVLSQQQREPGTLYWNPYFGEVDRRVMQDVDVVINLFGESSLQHTRQISLKQILRMRVVATNFLAELMEENPPKVYFDHSGFLTYPNKHGVEQTEADPRMQVGRLFEAVHLCNQIPKYLTTVRQIHLCMGLVLAKSGGFLKRQLPFFKWGFGRIWEKAPRYHSWVALEEIPTAIEHVIDHEEIEGTVNITSPNYVTHRGLSRAIAQLIHRPMLFRIPKWMVSIFDPMVKDLFEADKQVKPEVLLNSNYTFHYPNLKQVLEKELIS